MAPGKVVVLLRGNLVQKTLDNFNPFVPEGWKVTFLDKTIDESKVMTELADAEYIVTLGGRKISEKLAEGAKNLKLLQHGGQDVAHFPLQWAFKNGIPVANAGGANAIAVSEFTMLLILSSIRNFQITTRSIQAGNWNNSLERNAQMQLYDKVVGIVGLGNIGRRVAKLCYSFGANIVFSEIKFIPYAIRADMKAKFVSLTELLKMSDIVSVHTPSDPNNKAIIGWEHLSLMKPTAYLINTSRGVNVDEAALIRALNEKKIAGAALDVWNPEPPSPDNPLLKMPNVVTTPHMAASVWENIIPAFESVWRNILLVSEGKEPFSRITPQNLGLTENNG